MKNITNIEVEPRLGNGAFCVSWHTPEARFHFWTDEEMTTIHGSLFGTDKSPILYKNSHAEKTYDPGYFKCRHLDATTSANAKVIAFVIDHVRKHNLIEGGKVKVAAREQAEEQKRQEEFRARVLDYVRKLAVSEGWIDEARVKSLYTDDQLLTKLENLWRHP